MCDICVTVVSKIDSKTVPQKSSKIDPRLIFGGLGGGPKNGTPSKTPKSEFLLLFTTLQQGPGSQKGTPFRYHFGDPFSQKNEKRGFQKRAKNRPPTGTPVSVQSVSSQRPVSVQSASSQRPVSLQCEARKLCKQAPEKSPLGPRLLINGSSQYRPVSSLLNSES